MENNHEKINIEEVIGYVLFRTANAMRKSFMTLLKKEGVDITPEELAILITLWKEDGLFQSQINDKTYKDKTTVTRLLDRIKSKGYIEKKVDDLDRRNFRIYLTKDGDSLKNKMIPITISFNELFFRSAGEQEMQTTIRTLNLLFKLFHEEDLE